MSNPLVPENLVRLKRKFEISGVNLYSYFESKQIIRVTLNFNLNVFEITRVNCNSLAKELNTHKNDFMHVLFSIMTMQNCGFKRN